MADLDLLKEEVFHDYEGWIRENPEVTLKELRERLEKALEQCNDIAAAGDPRIDTYEDIPEPLASELRSWDNSGEECTFSYRAFNLEQFVQSVGKLMETVGDEYKMSQLIEDTRRSEGR
ncbi:MAG: hypothetical protein ACYC0X_19800 [Pirellulaceae bacterium]